MSSELTGVRLSPSEEKFIKDGIVQGIRSDGRGLFDLRHIYVKLSLLPQANGSARVRSKFSATDVLCGVKFEVGDVKSAPLQCAVEMGALARSDLFGPIEASKRAERRGVELADRLLDWLSGIVKLPTLIPGKAQWITTLECVVFGDGGNLQDSLFIACYAALRDARLPEVTLNDDSTDFDINAEYTAASHLDFNDRLTLPSTCWFIAGRCVSDPTGEEEACADGAMCVELHHSGKVKKTLKTGGGAVDLKSYMEAIGLASGTAKRIIKFIDSELDDSDKRFQSNIGKLVVQDQESWDNVCLSKEF